MPRRDTASVPSQDSGAKEPCISALEKPATVVETCGAHVGALAGNHGQDGTLGVISDLLSSFGPLRDRRILLGLLLLNLGVISGNFAMAYSVRTLSTVTVSQSKLIASVICSTVILMPSALLIFTSFGKWRPAIAVVSGPISAVCTALAVWTMSRSFSSSVTVTAVDTSSWSLLFLGTGMALCLALLYANNLKLTATRVQLASTIRREYQRWSMHHEKRMAVEEQWRVSLWTQALIHCARAEDAAHVGKLQALLGRRCPVMKADQDLILPTSGAPPMKAFLLNAFSAAVFKDALTATFNTESITFYLAVQHFRKLPPSTR